MRTSTAYFAGVGTVVVAIAAGLGGGLTIANVMSPNSPRQATHLEQRMSPQPVAASSQPDQAQQQEPQSPVPYVASNQAPAATPPAQSSAPPQTAAAVVSPQPAPAAEPPPADAAKDRPAKPSQALSKSRSILQSVPPSHEQAASSDDATKDMNDPGEARDADTKRQVDKRKSDRQQQWSDRRKHDQQQREQDLRDAQARMRDDDGPRDVVVRRDWRDDRGDYDRPTRFGLPGFNMFGPDD